MAIKIKNRRRRGTLSEILEILCKKTIYENDMKKLRKEKIEIFTSGNTDNGRLGRKQQSANQQDKLQTEIDLLERQAKTYQSYIENLLKLTKERKAQKPVKNL